MIQLNEIWPILLTSTKERQQNFDKCKKILEDLSRMDFEANETLTKFKEIDLKKNLEKVKIFVYI